MEDRAAISHWSSPCRPCCAASHSCRPCTTPARTRRSRGSVSSGMPALQLDHLAEPQDRHRELAPGRQSFQGVADASVIGGISDRDALDFPDDVPADDEFFSPPPDFEMLWLRVPIPSPPILKGIASASVGPPRRRAGDSYRHTIVLSTAVSRGPRVPPAVLPRTFVGARLLVSSIALRYNRQVKRAGSRNDRIACRSTPGRVPGCTIMSVGSGASGRRRPGQPASSRSNICSCSRWPAACSSTRRA